MRNTILAAALSAAVCLSGPACNRREKIRATHDSEAVAQIATVVHVADPRTASQLVSGFYDIEQNSWRWTAGKFAVVLRPPHNAAAKGATLELRFSIPDPVLARLKTVSLGASLGSVRLAPETYTAPGEFTYTRDVPANLLAGDAVRIDFSLDKCLPPSDADRRELGVVVTSVGLAAKS